MNAVSVMFVQREQVLDFMLAVVSWCFIRHRSLLEKRKDSQGVRKKLNRQEAKNKRETLQCMILIHLRVVKSE